MTKTVKVKMIKGKKGKILNSLGCRTDHTHNEGPSLGR